MPMFKVGDYEIDQEKIAGAVVTRLLQRATTHILSNECSSSVLSKTKRAIVGTDGDVKSVGEAALEAWRAANAEQVAAWEDEFRTAKIAAMYDGSLMIRVSRGPTRDPIESLMRAIAKSEAMELLKRQKVKWPTGDDTITLADGVTTCTADELIDRRLANVDKKTGEAQNVRIRKLAEREHANRLRLAKAKADALTDGADDNGGF